MVTEVHYLRLPPGGDGGMRDFQTLWMSVSRHEGAGRSHGPLPMMNGASRRRT